MKSGHIEMVQKSKNPGKVEWTQSRAWLEKVELNRK